MERAMELFQKAIHLSRTESEMAHLYSLLDAAHAQLKVAKNLGITIPSMEPQMWWTRKITMLFLLCID